MRRTRPDFSKPPTCLGVITAAAVASLLMNTSASGQPASTGPRLTPVEQGRGDTGPLATSNRVTPLDLRLPIGFDRVYRIEGSGRRGRSGDLFARQSGGLTAVFPRSQYIQLGSGLFPEIPAGTTFYIGGLPDSLTGAERPAATRRHANNYIDRSARVDLADAFSAGPASERTSTGASTPVPGTNAAQNRAGIAGIPSPIDASGSADPARTMSRSEAARASDAARLAAGPRPAPVRPSIFGDETYRRDKVSTLLSRAASATPTPGRAGTNRNTDGAPPVSHPAPDLPDTSR
ncbi:MAG: hypothetical protein KF787_12925 [Phycisphaeraceae bacterium]|nr:hypothetical protein [Phycisphaerae bacterium]MBX3393540.1 hypothetical protein [Phycisphaeraceae bacterium]